MLEVELTEKLSNGHVSTRPESIDFAANLRGKEGLDAVHQLMLAEIKLLEQMEQYAERRASLDQEYADKLAKLHEKVKVEETNNGSFIEKVSNLSIIYIYVNYIKKIISKNNCFFIFSDIFFKVNIGPIILSINIRFIPFSLCYTVRVIC